MKKAAGSKTFFKYNDAYLLEIRVKPNPRAHNEALAKATLARYNLTRIELKTFSSGAQSLSIDNAILGSVPKPFYHGEEHRFSGLPKYEPL